MLMGQLLDLFQTIESCGLKTACLLMFFENHSYEPLGTALIPKRGLMQFLIPAQHGFLPWWAGACSYKAPLTKHKMQVQQSMCPYD